MARQHLIPMGALAASALFLATSVSAQSIFPAGGIPGCDFASGQIDSLCIINFMTHLIQLIFGFTGVICLLTIIYSGYEWVLGSVSGGDTSAGKERLKWAIIGLIVCALAFYIIDFFVSIGTGA